MPLIANNIIVGDTIKKIDPIVNSQQPKKLTIFEKLKQQKVEQETPKVEEAPEKYKHIKEGELHKLINTNSSYLSDMIALKK